uniref:Ribonucleoside-diphosphate reductase n=1 Tax=Trypanosoma congolense (strain IL3000) TaxID=1068625 RepID=G0V163_TRYCI|nr:unnamed protein product [Trypanosoma congolense IL3000]
MAAPDENSEFSFDVINRSGEPEAFDINKLRERVEPLLDGIDLRYVNVTSLIDTVKCGIYENIKTDRLDQLLAETAAYSVTKHPDYGLLGGRLAVTALHKTTQGRVLEAFREMYRHNSLTSGRWAPLVSETLWRVVEANHEELENIIDYSRDLRFEYFGFKTLEKSYLLRVDVGHGATRIVERPQLMFLRVALGIHGNDLERVKETYDHMSLGYFTHATPTLFNAGTPTPQMSSCFLLAMREDSIEGIYDTLKQCAIISKSAGGIGVHVHNIRCAGSYIAGTNGTSNGLVPMLRVLNNTARYVDQGGGKRKGAFAVYLEPWHADILGFLLLKKNTGKDDLRARDLFYGLWIPDLFMERVRQKEKWTLMDPNTARGLSDCYGDEFKDLYERYEMEGRGVKTIAAHDLWFAILESQVETGGPFMLYKDACNCKSNQKNLGTIKCSNLCTEILEYTSKDEIAVCNLASIALPRCIEDGKFSHKKLRNITKIVTRNLNKVIDLNYYPLEEAKRSNMRNRPVGIGVQGLADTFALLSLPFASIRAKRLNRRIFENIYYAAVETSVELAAEQGKYETFDKSPASEGLLQFDLWDRFVRSKAEVERYKRELEEEDQIDERNRTGGEEKDRVVDDDYERLDWEGLKKRVMSVGMRNSLLIAPMPTASTSQILGNNECIEPFTSNIYVRRVLSGEFPVVNKYLVRALIEKGLWNDEMRNKIITYNGSISSIKEIPEDIRELYKVVWEIRQRDLIDMAVARGRYVDQSQSLNLFLEKPTSTQLSSMHFYTWERGLKTGMYYLRSKPAADAIKFTVDPKEKKKLEDGKRAQQEPQEQGGPSLRYGSGECLNCGS